MITQEALVERGAAALIGELDVPLHLSPNEYKKLALAVLRSVGLADGVMFDGTEAVWWEQVRKPISQINLKLTEVAEYEERYPIIPIPGSRNYLEAYDWGAKLEKIFPGQDAESFAQACMNNHCAPIDKRSIIDIKLIQQGYNDGPSWIWEVTLEGEIWVAEGWADFSGWDCQSGLEWTRKI